jgi:anti-sigma28 factor (negative regulator of flagellin synthesis)
MNQRNRQSIERQIIEELAITLRTNGRLMLHIDDAIGRAILKADEAAEVRLGEWGAIELIEQIEQCAYDDDTPISDICADFDRMRSLASQAKAELGTEARALRLAEIKASIQSGSYSDLDPIRLAVTTDEILRECQNRG